MWNYDEYFDPTGLKVNFDVIWNAMLNYSIWLRNNVECNIRYLFSIHNILMCNMIFISYKYIINSFI